MKTQGSLPTEDAAIVLLFSLVASGQIKLRKLDGFEEIAAMLANARRPHRVTPLTRWERQPVRGSEIVAAAVE